MNVVPDVLPSLHPSFDLRVTFPGPLPQTSSLQNRANRRDKQVEPGLFLASEQVPHRETFLAFRGLFVNELSQTRKQPTLYTTVFHEETRLYTLLMVDPGTSPSSSKFSAKA